MDNHPQHSSGEVDGLSSRRENRPPRGCQVMVASMILVVLVGAGWALALRPNVATVVAPLFLVIALGNFVLARNNRLVQALLTLGVGLLILTLGLCTTMR